MRDVEQVIAGLKSETIREITKENARLGGLIVDDAVNLVVVALHAHFSRRQMVRLHLLGDLYFICLTAVDDAVCAVISTINAVYGDLLAIAENSGG